jgi:hypothetical protein
MKPAQIRVFDGLRITTDHVNHLQGALASGFEDFRAILGLGQVQTGLDVSVADDGSVVIQPGLAFDFQKNRVVCDDPLNLKVTFEPPDHAKFICLKYEQVEDGPVDGHPTMIWDSCSPLIRDALPELRENLVTLAKVVKDADGKLSVCAPDEPETCLLAATPIVMVPVGPDVPSTGLASDAPSSPPPTKAPPVSRSEVSAPQQPANTTTPSAATAPAAPLGLTPVQFRQGVLRLVADPGSASYMRTVLAPALRKKLGAGSIDLSFSLGQADLTPDVAVSSINTHCVLSGGLAFSAGTDAPQQNHRFQCIASGESTVATGGMLQFAALTLHTNRSSPAPDTLWSGGDFTARGVAQFAFATWRETPQATRPPLPDDVLAGTQLLAQLIPAAAGFEVRVSLLWSGTVSEESVQKLETQEIGFTWDMIFGWKAVGY